MIHSKDKDKEFKSSSLSHTEIGQMRIYIHNWHVVNEGYIFFPAKALDQPLWTSASSRSWSFSLWIAPGGLISVQVSEHK